MKNTEILNIIISDLYNQNRQYYVWLDSVRQGGYIEREHNFFINL